MPRLRSAPQTSDSASNNPLSNIIVRLEVGSTTVKSVVIDPETDETLWKDYKRHEARQPEIVFQFLQDILLAFPLHKEDIRILITGSAGSMLREFIRAKIAQEVNAVSLAVESLYPDAGSVLQVKKASRPLA